MDDDYFSGFPSVHDLFIQYNDQYFHGKLVEAAVSVEWSSRMTLCAGLCYYERRTKSCRIKLSEALLKFRPFSDTVNTLLHEMIHAYLFITENNRDREGHGATFQSWMHRINLREKSKITVFHTFHEEVQSYRKHIWRCSGSCHSRPPYYGYVKRSMNRPPQLADPWFLQHQNTCGGNFVKISGPANRRNNAEPSKNDLSNGDFPGNNTASSPAKYTLLHYWKLKGKGIRLGSSNELPLGFPKSESLLQENDEAIEKRGNFIDLTLEGD